MLVEFERFIAGIDKKDMSKLDAESASDDSSCDE